MNTLMIKNVGVPRPRVENLHIAWEGPVSARRQFSLAVELRLLSSLNAERAHVAQAVRNHGFQAHVGGHHVVVLQGQERVALITGIGEDWK